MRLGGILTSLLLALAIASFWFLGAVRDTLEPRTRAAFDGPVITVHDPQLNQFSDNGVLQYRLSAKRFDQYPDDQDSRFEQPLLIAYTTSETPAWSVQSQRARLTADGEFIHLEEKVIVERAAIDEQLPLRLDTSRLLVSLSDNRVQTAEPVLMTIPGGTLSAVGLEGWLDTRILQLHHRVKGFYHAPEP